MTDLISAELAMESRCMEHPLVATWEKTDGFKLPFERICRGENTNRANDSLAVTGPEEWGLICVSSQAQSGAAKLISATRSAWPRVP